MYNEFSTGFSVFPIIFAIVFMLVIGVFIYIIALSIKEKVKNDKSPRLMVEAVLVGKRTHHSDDFTSYYATFQFESGDRTEFHITSDEYGQFVEGDYGQLVFQGTRFLSFNRTAYLTNNN